MDGGAGGDSLFGGDGGDHGIGGSGDDRISGGNGADTLSGGSGTDRLTGGSGSDSFVFAEDGSGLEAVITDFTSCVGTLPVSDADTIVLDVAGGSGAWIGDATFDGNEPQARFAEPSNRIQVDSDGDGSADFEIRLAGITQVDQLTATDFVFE